MIYQHDGKDNENENEQQDKRVKERLWQTLSATARINNHRKQEMKRNRAEKWRTLAAWAFTRPSWRAHTGQWQSSIKLTSKLATNHISDTYGRLIATPSHSTTDVPSKYNIQQGLTLHSATYYFAPVNTFIGQLKLFINAFFVLYQIILNYLDNDSNFPKKLLLLLSIITSEGGFK